MTAFYYPELGCDESALAPAPHSLPRPRSALPRSALPNGGNAIRGPGSTGSRHGSQNSSASEVFAQVKDFAEQFLQEVDPPSGPASTCSRTRTLDGDHAIDVSQMSHSDLDGMDLRKAQPRRLNAGNLAAQIHRKTAQLAKVCQEERRSKLLARIDEIPMRVSASLQSSAENLAETMKFDLDDARTAIVGFFSNEQTHRAQQAEQAVHTVEELPEIIRNAFENSAMKAKEKVKANVAHMIKNIEDDNLDKDQIVHLIWSIMPEVQEVASSAAQEAAHVSKVRAVRKFDEACKTLPESELLVSMKVKIERQIPEAIPKAEAAATGEAVGKVEQAVAAVEAECEVSRDVSNQVVAETLLRAKVASQDGAEDELVAERMNTSDNDRQFGASAAFYLAGAENIDISLEVENLEGHLDLYPHVGDDNLNQGSFGHPDFCSRACIYHARGECYSGKDCSFCHLAHPKRCVHLDKRHREMLRDMTFSDRVRLIFPILRDKIARLQLGDQALTILEELWREIAIVAAEEDGAEALSGSDVELSAVGGSAHGRRNKRTNRRSLGVVLGAMNVRSLLLMLNGRVGRGESNPQTARILAFLRHCRLQSYLRHQLGVVEAENSDSPVEHEEETEGWTRSVLRSGD